MDQDVLVLGMLVLVALVGLGAIVGLVMLFTNPKTRTAGWVVSIALLVLILAAAFLWHFRGYQMSERLDRARNDASADVATTARRPVSPSSRPEAHTSSPDAEPKAEPPVAEARPSWVDRPPHLIGESYRTCVKVGPYVDRLECDAKLPEALQRELAKYVETHLGSEAAGQGRLTPEIREAIVEDHWEEPIQASFGPMVQLHVLLEFDPDAKKLIEREWHKAIVARRLWFAGVGLLGVVGLLAVVFGYLRIDQATGGSCRGRLSLAAVLAVLAVLAGGYSVLHSVCAEPVTPHAAPPAAKPVEPTNHAAAQHGDPSAPAAGVRRRVSLLVPTMGVFLLGGIVLLLSNKKTRVAGLVVLAVAVVGALVLVA